MNFQLFAWIFRSARPVVCKGAYKKHGQNVYKSRFFALFLSFKGGYFTFSAWSLLQKVTMFVFLYIKTFQLFTSKFSFFIHFFYKIITFSAIIPHIFLKNLHKFKDFYNNLKIFYHYFPIILGFYCIKILKKSFLNKRSL